MQASDDFSSFEADFARLDNITKSNFVLSACLSLTIVARTTYLDRNSVDIDKLIKINEIQHRLLSISADLLTSAGDLSRRNIVEYMRAGFDDISALPVLLSVISKFRNRSI
ncbi:MAG: hypothetical protein WAV18_26445 [Roseiarcus sp.]